jgi:hypothetical protein
MGLIDLIYASMVYIKTSSLTQRVYIIESNERIRK